MFPENRAFIFTHFLFSLGGWCPQTPTDSAVHTAGGSTIPVALTSPTSDSHPPDCGPQNAGRRIDKAMSDSAGGGESGGVAAGGQDSEADGEPPQQVPPLLCQSEQVEQETPEDGLPPSAKRSRMREEEQGDGTPTEPESAQGNTSTSAQSKTLVLLTECV